MKKWYVLVAAMTTVILVTIITVGSVQAASSDQGRRLAGPFCVGKSFLRPLDGGRATGPINLKLAILRAGVVRSVALNQPCRPWENRRVGLAIPCPTLTPVNPSLYCEGKGAKGDKGDPGVAGPAGTQGAQGATGPTGATGAAGPIGPKGETGAAGLAHVEQGTGPDANCALILGSDGSSAKICGAAGATGAQGPPGPRGPAGEDGKCKCHEEPPPDPCIAGGKCGYHTSN
jgi:hypothetical protein